MGKNNSRALLQGLMTHKTHCYSSKRLASDIQILAMMSEKSASITLTHEGKHVLYKVDVSTHSDIIEPSSKHSNYIETLHSDYNGQVYCIEVPNHIFMVRRNGKYHWTGNSSRSGQKGICALLMREADMPVTEDGIRPTMIFNPHGMSSRMTCAQLIESLLINLCAIKGTHFDATMFKKVDIESIAEELEQYGFNRYGYRRMISGITGEYMDTLVFFGPTFYQRLQKFIADAEYSVRHALT